MNMGKFFVMGLATLVVLTPPLPAQVAAPAAAGAAGAGAGAAGAGGAAGAAGAAPAGGTIWNKLGLHKGMCKECLYKLCKTPIGGLLNNAFKPVATFSGGMIPGFCPMEPSPADLAQPGAQGAAAEVQKDTVEAKARAAAVRYLGTVDCHWWPEAEAGLILALRTDKNVCVRREAAAALGNGCCCTRKTIEALAIVVAGSEADKNPSETSEGVKALAEVALQQCLACYERIEPAPAAPPKPPEKPPEKAPEKAPEKLPPPTGPVTNGAAQPSTPPANGMLPPPNNSASGSVPLPAFYTQLDRIPMSLILADARRAMAKRVRENQAVAAAQAPRTHSMADLVMNALNGHPEGVPGELDHPNVALPSPEYLGPPQATPAHPQVAVVVPNQEPPALEKTLTTDVPSLTPPKLPEVSPAPVKPVVAVSALPVLSPTGSLLVPKLPEPVPVDATPDVHPIPTLTPPSPPEKPAASLPLAEGAWMAGSSLPSTAAAGASGVAMPAAGATDQPSAVIAPPQGIPIDPLPTPSQGLTSTKNGMASEGGPSSYHTTGAPESNGAVAGGATSTPTLLPARTPPYEAMGTPAPFQPGTVAASPGGATAAYHPAASEWRPMPTPSPNATRLPPGLGLPQLLSILTTSDYPSQREAAADALGAVDWRLHPEVVTCLTRAARQDAVPMVRVQCIRSLVRLNVSGTMVASTFQYLQVDVDPQVRREARQALTQVSAGRPLSAAPGMDPAQPQGTGWSIMGN